MISFDELLSGIDFKYEIKKNEDGSMKLCLIDEEKAYLGGKYSYETDFDPAKPLDAIMWAIDRLDIYWQDGVVRDVISNIDDELSRDNLAKLSGSIPDMLEYIENHDTGIDEYDKQLLTAVCHPEQIDLAYFNDEAEENNSYTVPVTWTMCSAVRVKGAKSLQHAISLVEKYADDIPLPDDDNAVYVDASYQVEGDYDSIKTMQSQCCALVGAEINVTGDKPTFEKV